jgi:hypothetical protein
VILASRSLLGLRLALALVQKQQDPQMVSAIFQNSGSDRVMFLEPESMLQTLQLDSTQSFGQRISERKLSRAVNLHDFSRMTTRAVSNLDVLCSRWNRIILYHFDATLIGIKTFEKMSRTKSFMTTMR